MTTTRVLSFDVGIKNLSFADVSFSAHPPTIEESDVVNEENKDGLDRRVRVMGWDVVDFMDNARSTGIDHLSTLLLECLRDRFCDNDVTYDHVIIENQPVAMNPTMKTIQIILYTYFQTVKMLFGCVKSVSLVSATLKLRSISDTAKNENGTMMAHKPTYAERKKLAVKLCRDFLGSSRFVQDNISVERFEKCKKKDDLADSLLQALAFHDKVLIKKTKTRRT
jgi:hypothetical protein